ncbi:type IV pilin protein [Candidiatus Paracoxiella cheracis]|uniref:type IV pilin protein n=1 Tax=Candidiatus Paracoxiella cheracis TaxID=3405120 RepID=UPI003BF60B1E
MDVLNSQGGRFPKNSNPNHDKQAIEINTMCYGLKKNFKRKPLTMRYNDGYSLIELLVTLAIIVILASVAYPIYTHHIMSARRKHAEVMLLSLAERMENYHSVHGDYQHATLAALKINTQDGSLKTQSTIDSYASIIELFRKLVGIID